MSSIVVTVCLGFQCFLEDVSDGGNEGVVVVYFGCLQMPRPEATIRSRVEHPRHRSQSSNTGLFSRQRKARMRTDHEVLET